MAEQTVELAPGESKVVSFEAIPQEARTYQVSVDGLAGSLKVSAPAIEGFDCRIGIYDEKAEEYVSGTIIVDGIEHFTTPYWTGQLPKGRHTLDLIVPSGYQFFRFRIFDWDTGDLLHSTKSRPAQIDVNTRLFIQAEARIPLVRAEVRILSVSVAPPEYYYYQGHQLINCPWVDIEYEIKYLEISMTKIEILISGPLLLGEKRGVPGSIGKHVERVDTGGASWGGTNALIRFWYTHPGIGEVFSSYMLGEYKP